MIVNRPTMTRMRTMNEHQTTNGKSTLPVAAASARENSAPGPGGEPAAQRSTTPSWLQPLQLRIEEVSVLTALSVRTLKRMTAAGEVPGATRIGRSLRYNRRVIEKWIE